MPRSPIGNDDDGFWLTYRHGAVESIISRLGRCRLASGILLPTIGLYAERHANMTGEPGSDDPCRGTRDNYKGTSAGWPGPFNDGAPDLDSAAEV